tara:strand:- start:2019 stop:2147 length:129 start_codon:yes stop_codon:yes gene_type:complete
MAIAMTGAPQEVANAWTVNRVIMAVVFEVVKDNSNRAKICKQ